MKNKEIEIRFLVTELAPNFPFHLCTKNRMIQGYIELASPKKSFRARLIDNEVTELTAKSGRGMVRTELKLIREDRELAKFLINNLADHKLPKERFTKDGWEIDFCKSNLDGIIIAEKEFESIGDVPTNPSLPSWIGKGINVTDSLTSHHLARLNTFLEGKNIKAIEAVLAHLNPLIPKIVITGPPCSGKTKIIRKIKEKMSEFHCVPEVASIVIGELGIVPGKGSVKHFQETIYKIQRIFENTSAEYARDLGKKAIILDRGTIDSAAYFTGGLPEFEKALKTSAVDEYKQYSAVICLETAPKDIYEKEKINNSARSENYLQAFYLGQRMQEVWSGHKNFHFVDNGSGWDEKERKVFEIIDQILKKGS